MCFVDLEKAFDRVPGGVLSGVLWEYGVRGPLLRAVRSLYDRSRSCVRIAGSKSDLFPVHVGLHQGRPCHRFCSLYLWTEFLGAVMGRKGSGLGTTGFHLYCLRTMLSCWLHRTRTCNVHWGGLQPSVKLLG
ncbi:hypothetical protein NL108_008255 [Boleophthalmus pectinirostris]|nr:hypothetical protein NL108_008255 [Boleophthalmus pectinirostris]